jgi:ATP-binding cassette subfamily C (CFTR/MRP) protein 1
VQSIYLKTSRQLCLLDLEAKSPLYTHYGETFGGLATIRAFDWQPQYIERAMKLLGCSQSPFYLLYCAQCWLNFVLDMMMAGIATLLVGVGVALKATSNGGSISVALVNIITFSQNLPLLIQYYTTMEISLGAIARVEEMVDSTPLEAQVGEDQGVPPQFTKYAPSIQFRSASVKVGPDATHPILNDVTLDIPSGKKTAIVGPSGSGKSSLLLAIARVLSLDAGHILLEAIDIACIKRDALR